MRLPPPPSRISTTPPPALGSSNGHSWDRSITKVPGESILHAQELQELEPLRTPLRQFTLEEVAQWPEARLDPIYKDIQALWIQVLHRYQSVWGPVPTVHESKLPQVSVNLKPGTPRCLTGMSRHVSPKKAARARKAVAELVKQGAIERTAFSPTLNVLPVVFASKYDSHGREEEALRLTLDSSFINLHRLFTQETELPKIRDFPSIFLHCLIFSDLDLRSWFYQLFLTKESRDLCGFRFDDEDGKVAFYRFLAAPMGFHFTPGLAQDILQNILANLPVALRNRIAAYVDNITLGTRANNISASTTDPSGNTQATEAEIKEAAQNHLEYLTLFLELCDHWGLKLKRGKCTFFQASVRYPRPLLRRQAGMAGPPQARGLAGSGSPHQGGPPLALPHVRHVQLFQGASLPPGLHNGRNTLPRTRVAGGLSYPQQPSDKVQVGRHPG